MNDDLNDDLNKMKPVIYPDNKVFCLTPENKIDKWIKIIQEKALAGYKVKLYSDIESTGFAFWNRGRPIYDKIIDETPTRKDSMKFGIQIESIVNKDFPVSMKHPYCSSDFFELKNPTSFAIIALGESVLSKSGYDWSVYKSNIDNFENKMNVFDDLLLSIDKSTKTDLMVSVKSQIRNINDKAFKYLEKETISLATKIDRMIEYAFVTSYENQDGEVFLLKDDDGDLIYLHEFVNPLDDDKVSEEQTIEEMPIIPYIIHKTTFGFLKGEEDHPFLNIRLDKPAPNSGEIFKVILRLFDYDGTAEEKNKLAENIMFFYQNGNKFDVPFLDAEMNRYFEEKRLRDLSQVYDTLVIAKGMIPSDVQKFIASCQLNKNFGGNEALKLDLSVAIKPTSKALDNIKRLASYLIDFNPNRPKSMYEKAQEQFFNMFKNYFVEKEIDWKKFENMLEYTTSKNPDLNLAKGFKKATKKDLEYFNLVERYKKCQEGRKEYVKSLNNIKKHDLIYKNLTNIQENIKNNKFLSDALYRLNNTDRSAHGARVDSQLFMDAFIVLEGAFYLKPKMSKNKRSLDLKSLEIPEDKKILLEKLLKGA